MKFLFNYLKWVKIVFESEMREEEFSGVLIEENKSSLTNRDDEFDLLIVEAGLNSREWETVSVR